MKKPTITEQLDTILFKIRCIRYSLGYMAEKELSKRQKEARELEGHAARIVPRARGNKRWINATMADIRAEAWAISVFLPKQKSALQ